MRLTLCIVYLCLLTACSPSPREDAEPRSYPGEVPAPLMTEEEARSAERALEEAMSAASQSAGRRAEIPVLKPGLWQVTYAREEMGFSETREICVDAALASRLAELPANVDAMTCSERQVRVEGNAVELDTVCSRNGTTVTTHVAIQSPDDTRFHHTMEAVHEPASAGHGIVHTTADGRYLGACPGGMAAGASRVVDRR